MQYRVIYPKTISCENLLHKVFVVYGIFSSCSIEVFFILVDQDGAALSGAEALDLLGRSNVLTRLRGYGYQATGYAAVVPPSQGSAKSGKSVYDKYLFFFKPTVVMLDPTIYY